MSITQYQGDGSINVLHSDTFIQDGETVDRMVLDVKGHDVQILCYNGDTRAVVVAVDHDMAQMPLAKADGYIKNRI